MKRSSKKTNRFTLLELMIALLLLGMMLGTLVAAGFGIMESWRRYFREKDYFYQLLTVDRTLEKVFCNMIPFSWKDEETRKDVPCFVGEGEYVQFAYVHRADDLREGGLRFVAMYLEDGNWMLTYQSRPMLERDDSAMEAEKSSTILFENVESLRFEYADMDRDREIIWLEEWDPDREREEIPLAVSIEVVWENGKREVWLFRTSGSSLAERFGNWKPRRDL